MYKLEQASEPGQGPWTVHVNKSGQKRVLRPRHVVFAHGLYGGAPKIPVIPGMVRNICLRDGDDDY